MEIWGIEEEHPITKLLRSRAQTAASLALAAALSLGLSSCAGAGSVDAMQQAMDNAKAEFQSCRARVSHKPEYASLLMHAPSFLGDGPTLAQRADPTIPTEADAQAILALDHEMEWCRNATLAAEGRVDLALADAWRESASEYAQVYALLVQRRVTWGAANQALEVAALDAERRWQAALAFVNSKLANDAMARSAAIGGWANMLSATAASMRH